MIRKLGEEYKEELLDFVMKDKELNLFIIGDIENYGFNEEFLEYWGEFDEKERLKAVLMRYYESFVVYSKEEFDVSGFLQIMLEHEFKILSGEKSTIEKFSKYFKTREKRDTYFAKLNRSDKLYTGELIDRVLKTEIKDVKKIWELQDKKIDEFTDLPPLERMEKKYKDKTGRGYHIKNDEKEVISSAETGAENTYSAMVLGVCTDPMYRGYGYATAVLSKLCHDLLNEGKSLCLFYDNPDAGEIYKRIGFEDIGIWSIWKRDEN